MRVLYVVPLLISLLLVEACTIGGNISKLEIANKPAGENLRILLRDNWILYGELLEFEERTITVLVDQINKNVSPEDRDYPNIPALARVPFNKIALIHLTDLDHTMYKDYVFFNYKNIENKYFSRYPQGIDSELMKQLLQTYSQDSLWVI